MGKEQITLEVDEAAMQRLRDAGVDPQAYIERLLVRGAIAHETDAARQDRAETLRAEMAEGLAAYDRIIDEVGDWSAGLRTF